MKSRTLRFHLFLLFVGQSPTFIFYFINDKKYFIKSFFILYFLYISKYFLKLLSLLFKLRISIKCLHSINNSINNSKFKRFIFDGIIFIFNFII